MQDSRRDALRLLQDAGFRLIRRGKLAEIWQLDTERVLLDSKSRLDRNTIPRIRRAIRNVQERRNPLTVKAEQYVQTARIMIKEGLSCSVCGFKAKTTGELAIHDVTHHKKIAEQSKVNLPALAKAEEIARKEVTPAPKAMEKKVENKNGNGEEKRPFHFVPAKEATIARATEAMMPKPMNLKPTPPAEEKHPQWKTEYNPAIHFDGKRERYSLGMRRKVRKLLLRLDAAKLSRAEMVRQLNIQGIQTPNGQPWRESLITMHLQAAHAEKQRYREKRAAERRAEDISLSAELDEESQAAVSPPKPTPKPEPPITAPPLPLAPQPSQVALPPSVALIIEDHNTTPDQKMAVLKRMSHRLPAAASLVIDDTELSASERMDLLRILIGGKL